MDGICRMTGTNGTFIAENGGVFRVGYTGTLHIPGDQTVCRSALEAVQAHFRTRVLNWNSTAPRTGLPTLRSPGPCRLMK